MPTSFIELVIAACLITNPWDCIKITDRTPFTKLEQCGYLPLFPIVIVELMAPYPDRRMVRWHCHWVSYQET